MIHRLEKGYLLPGQTELLYAGTQVLAKLQSSYTVMLTGLRPEAAGHEGKGKIQF